MLTPTTPAGEQRYDHLPAAEAVRAAWTQPGLNPAWHAEAQQVVRDAMPLVARALERLAAEERDAPPRMFGCG